MADILDRHTRQSVRFATLPRMNRRNALLWLGWGAMLALLSLTPGTLLHTLVLFVGVLPLQFFLPLDFSDCVHTKKGR